MTDDDYAVSGETGQPEETDDGWLEMEDIRGNPLSVAEIEHLACSDD